FSEILLAPESGVAVIGLDIKKDNFNNQLKFIFKKLAKITHPDVSQVSPDNYIKAQEFYDNGDIENLYFMYNQLNSEVSKDENLITDIEQLECQIGFIGRSNKSISKELEGVYNSNEYILFIKCRSYEARGVDFYKEILKFN
ncbi:MAG TPA: hypothetical protein DIV86_02545, partial [Alphaproteobacteria bacterium]|nr:hypothetical protein [Alphaproteobacteria bacterium]